MNSIFFEESTRVKRQPIDAAAVLRFHTVRIALSCDYRKALDSLYAIEDNADGYPYEQHAQAKKHADLLCRRLERITDIISALRYHTI